jgi:D-alanyl-D-alanine carboxypeptidase/D-alanyl-D-alanine-endopeptidase (penicillin-binding protein 4)
MIPDVGRGGLPSVPPRSLILSVLGALALAACHATPPPKVVPPPPSSTRVSQLQRTINTVLGDPALARGTWGVAVKSLARDQTLFALNEHKLLMPASTLKVVTLAVAADKLGWDYNYRTSMLTIGSVENGVLKGDLLIVGSGDPTFDDWDGFASARFAEWATVLKRDGIRAIDGRIIGDDNAFDDDGLGTGWAWDDLAASYATSVSALQFNQNTAQLVVTPAALSGQPPRVEVAPESARLSVLNRSTTAGGGPPLSVRAIPKTSTVELDGTIPPTADRVLRNVSVPNPTLYFANAARDGLIRNGIEVVGPAVDIDDVDTPPDRTSAVIRTEVFSKGLSDIGSTMMKLSQNLFAETLLKTLGLRKSGVGSAASGRAVIDATLAEWGVPDGEVLEVDGSGLSRYNLITPDSLVTILTHVYRDERLRETFIGTLPRAGVDGTLGNRMKGTVAEDNVRAKTGSFSNARAVAGYMHTADGEPLVFAVLANNFGAPALAIDNATDAIIVALAKFSR